MLQFKRTRAALKDFLQIQIDARMAVAPGAAPARAALRKFPTRKRAIFTATEQR